jgi:3,4-dihydroxy 2-butanone 4-phosphate synthase / GTP cyclohydrolase II
MTCRSKVDGATNIVLQKGKVRPSEPTLVRMHGISIFDDVLGQCGPRKRTLQRALAEIGDEGRGIIVLLMPKCPDRLEKEIGGLRGASGDLRDYGIGAQILHDLGVHDMILLTNSKRNVVGLDGYGIQVVGTRSVPEA